ncbi:helix-turn-helix domain-containing protein [Streptomyces sp. NPDC004266]|uniref:AraC-like ligand-binding domain-containing protein n=1 Tax=Streptomyces sp. NPDC004266 TaxID=3364693 RepID=UPI00369E3070
MPTVFDTSDLPVEDRTAAWWELTSTALIPTDISFARGTGAGGAEEARASILSLELGSAALSSMRYSPLVSRRTPRMIRQSDPEFYQVAVIGSGRQGIDHVGNRVLLRPGQMVVYDSSRPFDAWVGSGDGLSRSMVLQFPKRLLPLSGDHVDRLLGTPLSTSSGMGRVLADLLRSVNEEHRTLSPSDLSRLGTSLIDLTATALGARLGRTPPLAPESRSEQFFLLISAYIEENLRTDLTPERIAGVHGISLRYLQRIFQEHGTTVSGTIRRRRVARCSRDLADPALRHLAAYVIGARWGLGTASQFNRVFARETGLSPARYRLGATHGSRSSPVTPGR